MYEVNQYLCDFCRREFPFVNQKEGYGDISECEVCGKHFCDECFNMKEGEFRRKAMMRGPKMLCPDCYNNRARTQLRESGRYHPAVEHFLERITECDTIIYAAEQVLEDNGIEGDEAQVVLQALGAVLLDTELYPE